MAPLLLALLLLACLDAAPAERLPPAPPRKRRRRRIDDDDASMPLKCSEIPICRFSEEGNVSRLKRAIARGVEVNRVTYPGKWTPLHRASLRGRVAAAALLLLAGADAGCTTRVLSRRPVDVAGTEEMRALLRAWEALRDDDDPKQARAALVAPILAAHEKTAAAAVAAVPAAVVDRDFAAIAEGYMHGAAAIGDEALASLCEHEIATREAAAFRKVLVLSSFDGRVACAKAASGWLSSHRRLLSLVALQEREQREGPGEALSQAVDAAEMAFDKNEL